MELISGFDGYNRSLEGFRQLRLEGVMYIPSSIDVTFQEMRVKVDGVTALSEMAIWNLYLLAKQSLSVEGNFFECGVDRGGSAIFLADLMRGKGKKLFLFDTFSGMPECEVEKDFHKVGDFPDSLLPALRNVLSGVDFIEYKQGFIPDTFKGMENEKIAFAHVDVDSYQSVKDCLEFIFPRMVKGGVILIDDYGQPTTIGCILATDEYFKDKKSVPIPFIHGGAMVMKL